MGMFMKTEGIAAMSVDKLMLLPIYRLPAFPEFPKYGRGSLQLGTALLRR